MFLSFLFHGLAHGALRLYHLEKFDRINSESIQFMAFGRIVPVYSYFKIFVHILLFSLGWPYVSGNLSTFRISNFLEYEFSRHFPMISEFFSNFINWIFLYIFS